MTSDVSSDEEKAACEPEEEDGLVAEIGEQKVFAADVLNCLISQGNWKSIEACLDYFLLEAEFEKSGIAATDEELRAEIAAFRHKHRLESGDDTRKWLKEKHMDESHFLEICEHEVKLAKLKEKLFANRLEEHYVYRRLEMATAELYKIELAQEEACREILSLVNEGESFFDFARKYSLDAETARACGYMGELKLRELRPQLQDLVSKSKAGSLLGPLKSGKNFELYLLSKIKVPELDADLRRTLLDELFDRWLADTKQRAAYRSLL